MKHALVALGLLVSISLLAGCQTPVRPLAFAGGTAETSPDPDRLKSGEDPDLVIYFPSWEYIGITKPLVADGAFLRFMNRAQAEETLKTFRSGKGVAVIICDLSIPGKDRDNDMEQWIKILSREGYRRAVFVRKEPKESLAEADVLREEVLGK